MISRSAIEEINLFCAAIRSRTVLLQADRILDFNPSEGDIIKIPYFKGTQGMDEISFAAVDLNKDGIGDTAILCSCADVVGIIMSRDPSKINLRSSIFMAGSQDTTLSNIR